MTKIEELKAALAAATPGEWINNDDRAPNLATVGTGERGWLGLAQMFGDTDDEANANAKFITLAHNLMPQLLEVVEVLKAVVPLMDIAFNYDGDVFGRQHNNATDVYSAAECVLGELK